MASALIACQPVHGVNSVRDRMPPDIAEALRLAANGSKRRLYALARRGGDGAWYALAETAAESDYPELVHLLRKKSYRNDPPPFAQLSLFALLVQDARALWNPLAVLRRAEKHYGPGDLLRQARIAVLVSLDRQQDLSQEIAGFTGQAWEAPVLAAAVRLNKNRFRTAGLFERFVLHCEEPSALALLPMGNVDLVGIETLTLASARINYAAGDDMAALSDYHRWLDMIAENTAACETENPPPVFAEIADAAMRLKQEKVWADRLYETADSLTGAKRYAAAYQSGKLYRARGRYREASEAFRTAAESLSKGLDADRAIWYRLKTIGGDVSISTDEELEAFSWAMAGWEKADRFSSLLEEFIHRRVRRGEWAALESYYRNWGPRWSDVSRAQAAFALAFAVHEGRVSGLSSREYLEEAYEAAPLTWWGLRAAGILDRDTAVKASAGIQKSSDVDLTAELLLRWGFVERVTADVLRAPERYSDRTIRKVSSELSKSNPRLSIRIIGLLLRREGYSPSREDLFLRFPQPYAAIAEEAALKKGVAPELFFGLIRTESAWDTKAVSRSGAEGLTQFMPATWEEWEERLKYPEDSNPMDPVTNLRFGAEYLSWLLEREWTSGWMDTLASYNAGGGRVRRWRGQQPGYGDDLFSMSIPLEEPRSYIAKVLSAGTIYGYLYAQRSPKELHESWNLPTILLK